MAGYHALSLAERLSLRRWHAHGEGGRSIASLMGRSASTISRELSRGLVALLRHGHASRLPRTRGIDRRSEIADMKSIHIRPPEVETPLECVPRSSNSIG